MGLYDDPALAKARQAQITSTTTTAPAPTITAAQKAYETRTGDAGNTVSGNSYTQPTVKPTATQPVAISSPQTITRTEDLPGYDPNWQPNEKIDTAVVAQANDGAAFNDTLAKFTEADINAALAAIEAEFGLTREELLRDQTMIGAQYRLLTAQLARQRDKALEQTEAGALQRGLFRSGIYAAEAGEVATEFADKQAEFRTAADSQQLAIEQRLAGLDAEKTQVQAQEETAIRRGEYTARLQAAGL